MILENLLGTWQEGLDHSPHVGHVRPWKWRQTFEKFQHLPFVVSNTNSVHGILLRLWQPQSQLCCLEIHINILKYHFAFHHSHLIRIYSNHVRKKYKRRLSISILPQNYLKCFQKRHSAFLKSSISLYMLVQYFQFQNYAQS